MLTARGDEQDRILGLEMGADDYLPSRSTRGSSARESTRSCGDRGRRRRSIAARSASWSTT
jgi:Response regulators consisting of a CheY-like receiver domain and a winged-helix DNA-binding domain